MNAHQRRIARRENKRVRDEIPAATQKFVAVGFSASEFAEALQDFAETSRRYSKILLGRDPATTQPIS